MIYKALRSKTEQAYRLILLSNLIKESPYMLVTEYPKSGGTWLGQLVSSYHDLPFPRNKLPKIEESILHGHRLPNKATKNLKNVFWLVRDGRDVMISQYYHSLIWNEKNSINPKDVYYNRKKLNFNDFEDIQTNLPVFIEYLFTNKPSKFQNYTFMGNWTSFNQSWLDYVEKFSPSNVLMIKYESLLNDSINELERICDWTNTDAKVDISKIQDVIDKYSFKNQTNRDNGKENTNSFLRKGISGDWKNYFNKECVEIFKHYAGDMLIKLNYEKDTNWDSFPPP